MMRKKAEFEPKKNHGANISGQVFQFIVSRYGIFTYTIKDK